MGKKFFANIVVCTLIIFLSIVTFFLIEVAAEDEGPAFYRLKIEPISNHDCARCHYAVFTDIRDKGGAHQMVCMKCHETFHTYKPGRDWKNVVPDCTTCHSQFHGDNLLDCTRCHENAHAPKVSLNFAKMATDCSVCHPDQKTEAALNPSAHTDKACFACHHDLHGYIPSCTECHRKPHTPFTKNAECNACHPSHSPLVVSYTENAEDAVCKGCHADVGNKLSSSDNRHAFLKCAFCHSDKHRYIPICQDCHGLEPHAKELLEKFSGCKDCHGDAHTLTSR